MKTPYASIKDINLLKFYGTDLSGHSIKEVDIFSYVLKYNSDLELSDNSCGPNLILNKLLLI